MKRGFCNIIYYLVVAVCMPFVWLLVLANELRGDDDFKFHYKQ